MGKENKKQSKETQAPKDLTTSHDTSRKRLGEPEQRNTKKRMASGDFQFGRMGFRPDWKKGQIEN